MYNNLPMDEKLLEKTKGLIYSIRDNHSKIDKNQAWKDFGDNLQKLNLNFDQFAIEGNYDPLELKRECYTALQYYNVSKAKDTRSTDPAASARFLEKAVQYRKMENELINSEPQPAAPSIEQKDKEPPKQPLYLNALPEKMVAAVEKAQNIIPSNLPDPKLLPHIQAERKIAIT